MRNLLTGQYRLRKVDFSLSLRTGSPFGNQGSGRENSRRQGRRLVYVGTLIMVVVILVLVIVSYLGFAIGLRDDRTGAEASAEEHEPAIGKQKKRGKSLAVCSVHIHQKTNCLFRIIPYPTE